MGIWALATKFGNKGKPDKDSKIHLQLGQAIFGANEVFTTRLAEI